MSGAGFKGCGDMEQVETTASYGGGVFCGEAFGKQKYLPNIVIAVSQNARLDIGKKGAVCRNLLGLGDLAPEAFQADGVRDLD